ncbi:hypothetical protein PRIPAC_73755 [Pristionchus pacificus]|uniref:G protein-coupled receptor n=1 Tax=Pristionchus pacificus TaxID=54126 RepID=A0A2A6CRW0_PRIPA|nr:hypothetical protein PRIPAC_73755 [Pristionchus pacificus]|eukprot:PDM80838.1 G protein-coupled receptor [Pristionchus pacificus]
MASNETSLRFGLGVDRAFLYEVFEYYRIILPIFNTLTLHPTMLLLLHDSKAMASDIRLGYLLNELALIFFDWTFSFALRMYPIMPYSAFFCGGPICEMIGQRWIHMLVLSVIITANIPCFLYLTMSMHKNTSSGLQSTLKITNRCTRDPNGEPELRWLVDRGGKLFVFGTFGQSQYFHKELFILGASILTNAPVPIIITFDAVNNLKSMRTANLSNKTAKMTQQLLSLFIIQLNLAMLSMVIPLTVLFSPFLVDLTEKIPGPAHLITRIFVLIFLTADSFQFPLVFILKCSGGGKANFVARFRRIFKKGTEPVLVSAFNSSPTSDFTRT